MDTILSLMSKIVDKKVQHYKDDFYKYDIESYTKMHDKKSFIWIVRKCGTFIAYNPKDSDYDELSFNDVKINANALIDYFTNYVNCTFYHVIKGVSIKLITPQKAKQIINSI